VLLVALWVFGGGCYLVGHCHSWEPVEEIQKLASKNPKSKGTPGNKITETFHQK